jgi:uncharacterized membrane protein YccC
MAFFVGVAVGVVVAVWVWPKWGDKIKEKLGL